MCVCIAYMWLSEVFASIYMYGLYIERHTDRERIESKQMTNTQTHDQHGDENKHDEKRKNKMMMLN